MKKLLLIFGLLSIESLQAQAQSAPTRPDGRTHVQHRNAQKRIGINTEKPVASLEIAKVSNVPATQVQGFLLPHLTQDERNAMEEAALVNGLMIFNTSKNCIEWWDGSHWSCTGSSGSDRHGDPYTRLHAWYISDESYTGNVSFTRDNCPAGQTGGSVVYSATVQARGKSRKSPEEARDNALIEARNKYYKQGQEYANTNGTCSSSRNNYSSTQSYTGKASFTRNNCPAGQTGGVIDVGLTTSATATSNVSQADADSKALATAQAKFYEDGQKAANLYGECTQKKCSSLNTMGNSYYTYVKHNGQKYNPVTYHEKMKNGTLPNGEFEVGVLSPSTEPYTCPRGRIAVREQGNNPTCWYMTLINTDAVLVTPGQTPSGWITGPRPNNVIYTPQTHICSK